MSKPAPQKPDVRFAIDSEVTRCIRQHARAHMTTEVCGVLIGAHRDGVVAVSASIEASNAAQAGTHVTFTQDAWETIYRVKDATYPDERIVGWYHSHPGFGVFLSEHDTFIHRNFFTSPDQVAWVYDPHTDEEGCFGWTDGEIHRLSAYSTVDNNGDGLERTPKETEGALPEVALDSGVKRIDQQRGAPPRWLRWGTTALTYLSAMLLGFAIAHFLFPTVLLVSIDPVTGEPTLVMPQAVRPSASSLQNAPAAQPGKAASEPKDGRNQ